MKDLYIIGAGGFGREVAWLVEKINRTKATWNLCGFIDDDASIHGKTEDGYRVLGGCDYLKELADEYWAVCAVGSPVVRKKIVEKISGYEGIHFAVLVDPDVEVSARTEVGEGTVICAGNMITVDIKIGRHNIINLGCTIGHDAVLEDYVTLYPSVNVSGMVHVGHTTELGTGAQIIQGLAVGENTVIGAGTVVVKDIPSNVTAVGSPAKVIKFHKEAVPRTARGYLNKKQPIPVADKQHRCVFYSIEESHICWDRIAFDGK